MVAAGWLGWQAGEQGSDDNLLSLVAALLPVWLLGTLVGLLLPRPKWLDSSSRLSSLLWSTAPGTFIRRAIIFCHGAFIVRDVWRYVALPGTFHAMLGALAHKLRSLFKLQRAQDSASAAEQDAAVSSGVAAKHAHAELDWCVTASDLEFFKQHAESPHDEPPSPGYGRWESILEFKVEGGSYAMWRRRIPTGKTEYKSVTVASGCTPEEVNDFYLDDSVRAKWDAMIAHYETLESNAAAGMAQHRLQAVLWRRTFPFSFISAREYVIGRRVFREGETVYGITKGVPHPRALSDSRVVRVDTYYSMWSSRPVPCPNGTGQLACETTLLHHEDMKVSEHLARLAVRHGAANFIKKMVPSLRDFVAERRGRGIDAESQDPFAYGLPGAPGGPPKADAMRRALSVPALCSSPSTTSVASTRAASDSAAVLSGRHRRRETAVQEVGVLRRFGTLALAAGVAVAVGRTAGSGARRHVQRPKQIKA